MVFTVHSIELGRGAANLVRKKDSIYQIKNELGKNSYFKTGGDKVYPNCYRRSAWLNSKRVTYQCAEIRIPRQQKRKNKNRSKANRQSKHYSSGSSRQWYRAKSA